VETYQYKYLLINIKNKLFKIFEQPKLFGFYFNEYFKNVFFNSNIDYYILSYPKSGRTWLFKILSLYSFKLNNDNFIKNRKLVNFDNKYIKFIHDCSDPNPYPVKALKFKNKDLVNKKKIILLRDPREIIISFWYQMKFREKTYDKNISEFIDDEYFGIEKLISFYNSINLTLLNNFKIVTYNHLVSNTFEEIKKIVNFFNLEINENLIKNCIKDCSFENLQKEEMKMLNSPDKRSMKFRSGVSGNFKYELNNEDIKKINDKIKNKLNNNFKKILNLENV
jgi:hypothetical protein